MIDDEIDNSIVLMLSGGVGGRQTADTARNSELCSDLALSICIKHSLILSLTLQTNQLMQ